MHGEYKVPGGKLVVVDLDVLDSHHVPADGRGDVGRVAFAQVPGVGFGHGSERADDGGGIRVRVDERGHGRPAAAGTAATTEGVHVGQV